MELTIAVVISIIGCVISVSSFVLNRKDKSNDDTEEMSYRQGVLDQQLKNIFEKLEKIEKKLDSYDREIDDRIEKALEVHIKQYHKEI